ncbi:MAG: PilZ domain-containing protein [Deltaproteobacteria bacterium]|nr:PilZ domain-containing protein [Deltaproteobacteria bacterium]
MKRIQLPKPQEVDKGALKPKEEYTSDGRYIPYAGGSAGWDDNAGVPGTEQSNNYRFHEIVDSMKIREVQFIRASEGFDKRGSRKRVLRSTDISLFHRGGTLNGSTHDISLFGMRLQFEEEIKLSKGETVLVKMLGQKGAPEMDIESKVMWSKTVGYRRPLWNIGIAFVGLSTEDSTRLRGFLEKDR